MSYDPSIPVLTFRTWVLGTMSCALLLFLDQFFRYRKELLSITSISAQIAVVLLGHLMERITDRLFFEGRRWEFTLKLGSFSMKEITIFTSSGAGSILQGYSGGIWWSWRRCGGLIILFSYLCSERKMAAEQVGIPAFQEKKMDVYTRLMNKYNLVPEWWFICILVANIVLTIFACEYYIDQLQL